MPFPKASRALERFTVLDLTRVRSGPTCVRQLADWGANVIKIELPPDPGGGEPLGGPREGADFQNLHRNKRSMTLNLKAPEAVAAFRRMVKKADVVVENFRPDVKRRLGIDYEKGQRAGVRTANGAATGYLVKLDTIGVGSVMLYGIDAIVIEGSGLATPLLGMSFLNRMNMKREGDIMTLTSRF